MRVTRSRLTAAALLLPLALSTVPAAARAQSLRFLGVDGMMQTIKPQGQSGVSGLALRTRLQSDDLPAGMSLMPSIEYWRNADRLDDFGVRATQSDFTAGVDGRFDFRWRSVSPYLGGGLGLHFIKQEFVASALDLNQRIDHTKLGPDVFAGVQMAPAGWLQSFFETKFAFVPSYRQFKLNWGVGVNF
jgi:opacity protein-like surface antigen